MEQESDICQCRKCGKLEVRKHDGYYPDGRNKKFVNAEGKLWSGRACPKCVRSRVRAQIQVARAERKKCKDQN